MLAILCMDVEPMRVDYGAGASLASRPDPELAAVATSPSDL